MKKSNIHKYRKNIYSIRSPRLQATESKAFNYLTKIGITIDESKIKIQGKPDFVGINGREYEIKRLEYCNEDKSQITFNKSQIEKFKDDVIVLIFEPFKSKPTYIYEMKEIKKSLSKRIKLPFYILINNTY